MVNESGILQRVRSSPAVEQRRLWSVKMLSLHFGYRSSQGMPAGALYEKAVKKTPVLWKRAVNSKMFSPNSAKCRRKEEP